MTNFSYTGKEFPKTGYFYETFFDGKSELIPGFQYILDHGTFVGENAKRVFAKNIEREPGKTVETKYKNLIRFLIEENYIEKGEKLYRITKKGKETIFSLENGGSCNFETSFILKGLYALQKNIKKIPVDYCKPIKHFKLLEAVEYKNPDFIKKADFFNTLMEKASKKGLVEIIMPSVNGKNNVNL